MKAKRFGAFFAALFFFIVSILFPVREARAMMPAVALAGYTVRFAAPAASRLLSAAPELARGGIIMGTTLTAAGLLQAGQSALGSVVGSVGVFDSLGKELIHLALDPREPDPTPEGWTPPAPNSGASAIPPPTSSSTFLWTSHVGTTGPSPEAAVQAWSLCNGGCVIRSTVVVSPTQTQVHFCSIILGDAPNCNSPYDRVFDISSSPSAPSGYSNCVDGICQLTNPSAVQYPSDGGCNIRRNSDGTFSSSSRDPDCASPSPGISIGPNQITITGSDGKSTSFTNNGGTLSIVDAYPTSAGNTEKQELAISPPASVGSPEVASNSSITGGRSSTVQGTGSFAGSVPIPVSISAPSSGYSSIPSITLPTDYNREATQTQIANDIGAIKNSLSNVSVPNVSVPSNIAVPLPADLWKVKYENGFKGVWDAKKDAFTSSSFIQALDGFKPGFESGGSCPHFVVNLDFPIIGPVSGDLAPPCWLLDAIGVIMLISAAFACRRIIFGG